MELKTSLRVGIFGGTFDPPHHGHLALAVQIRHCLSLDRMLLVVANDPWQKTVDHDITPAHHRLAMVRLAVATINDTIGDGALEACDHEIKRGGPSYTVDTLASFRQKNPSDDLYLVVGANLVATLNTWKRAEELTKLAKLVVATDNRHTQPLNGCPYQSVTIPWLPISSTDLRESVRKGQPIVAMTSPEVAKYVSAHGLYRGIG